MTTWITAVCWGKMIRFSLLCHLWVCQEWLSSSGRFMNSLHLMKCTFVGWVFHPKFPHLLHSHLRNKGPWTHYKNLSKACLWCHDRNWNDSESLIKGFFLLVFIASEFPEKVTCFLRSTSKQPMLYQSFPFGHRLNQLLSARRPERVEADVVSWGIT